MVFKRKNKTKLALLAGGHTSLLVTRIDDRMGIEANRDRIGAANEPLYFCERIAA